MEIKSGQTPSGAYFSAFDRLEQTLAGRVVVYGGEDTQERSKGKLLSWRHLDRHPWV